MSGLILPGHPLFSLAAPSGINVADVFSVDIWTGTGAAKTITNGIDLAGEGGLAWIKRRNGTANHRLFDTLRGVNKSLSTDLTGGELNAAFGQAFLSDGFSVDTGDLSLNNSSGTYVGWSFRRSPRFFDIVTWTGNGVAGRTIPHNLGVVPGMIVVKRRDSTSRWPLYHRDIGYSNFLDLQTTGAAGPSVFYSPGPHTDAHFYIGASTADINQSGGTYVAYLFAHDPAADGVIQCGSYAGNGSSTGPIINLGWEPQWVMIKKSNSTGEWFIFDTSRVSGANDLDLRPNSSSAEAGWFGTTRNVLDYLPTGFQPRTADGQVNNLGDTYIYMAIRAEGA